MTDSSEANSWLIPAATVYLEMTRDLFEKTDRRVLMAEATRFINRFALATPFLSAHVADVPFCAETAMDLYLMHKKSELKKLKSSQWTIENFY